MQLEEYVLDLLHCFIKHILKEIIYKTILKVKSRKYKTHSAHNEKKYYSHGFSFCFLARTPHQLQVHCKVSRT